MKRNRGEILRLYTNPCFRFKLHNNARHDKNLQFTEKLSEDRMIFTVFQSRFQIAILLILPLVYIRTIPTPMSP